MVQKYEKRYEMEDALAEVSDREAMAHGTSG